jgi:hypothetical protein
MLVVARINGHAGFAVEAVYTNDDLLME